MMRIGLIGLGIMGRPMAKNMLKAGYALMVNDLNREAVEDVVSCGAVAANTPVLASAIPSKSLRRLTLRALHASHIRISFCLTPMPRRGSIAAVPHSKHVAVHIPQTTTTRRDTRDDRSISRSEARMRVPRRQELKNSACGITGHLL